MPHTHQEYSKWLHERQLERYQARRRLFFCQVPAIILLATIVVVRVASNTVPNGLDVVLGMALLITAAFALGNYRLLRTRRHKQLQHGSSHHRANHLPKMWR